MLFRLSFNNLVFNNNYLLITLSSKKVIKVLLFFDDNKVMKSEDKLKDNDRFWERVKTLIKERHITQEALAKEIGTDYGSLKQQIFHSRMPYADVATKIAKALNTSVEYLVTGIEPSNDNSETIELIKKALLILER